MKILHAKKCLSCPYYKGTVKCVKSPCEECMLSKKKTNPFESIKVTVKGEKNNIL